MFGHPEVLRNNLGGKDFSHYVVGLLKSPTFFHGSWPYISVFIFPKDKWVILCVTAYILWIGRTLPSWDASYRNRRPGDVN